MTAVRLLHGPCDPRDVQMRVSRDATKVRIRPMPFRVEDVYMVVDRFVDAEILTHATGEYLYTAGPRSHVDHYRRALSRLGANRAFILKRKRDLHVH